MTRIEGRVLLEERSLWLDVRCTCGLEYPNCPVCYELAESGWDEFFGTSDWETYGEWNWLVETGLYLGQEFAVEAGVHYSQDYWGECDIDKDWRIVWRGPVKQSMITRTAIYIAARYRDQEEHRLEREKQDFLHQLRYARARPLYKFRIGDETPTAVRKRKNKANSFW